MIKQSSFSQEWINTVSEKYQYHDRNLIEKVIRAYSLLEMLVKNGCPAIWKGGSSLMLILGDSASRLSVDIDIICPPGTDIMRYLNGYEQFGFTDCTMIERQQRSSVPKSHSKLHYEMAYKNEHQQEDAIVLDVLYEDSQYRRVDSRPIVSPFFEGEEPAISVRVPSVNDILGDKLTAFAPNTCGIPYFKSGRTRSLDIIKQLFDVSRLMDAATDFSVVRDVFNKIVPIELGYREQAPDVAPVYEDIRQTALCISTRGAEGIGQFDLLQDGIKRMQAFMLRRRYMIEDATVDAAKAALLATMLEKGVDSFTPYSSDLEGLAKLRLADTVPVRLSRIRRNNPEAYYYWVKVSELLKR